jgi:4'-phosphopantetheinyl transferase
MALLGMSNPPGKSNAIPPPNTVWERSPPRQLGAGEIHIWRVPLDAPMASHYGGHLSASEQARRDRFHFERDRRCYEASRGCLRARAGVYLGRAPSEIEFQENRYGRPEMADPGDRWLHFNVSHSGAWAVIAFGRDMEVGIDIEQHRSGVGLDLARRFFSKTEVDELAALGAAVRDLGFFSCWTRKEAYVKALGTGMSTALDSFSVSLSPGDPVRFLAGAGPQWQLLDFEVAEGYSGALAHDGGDLGAGAIHYFDLDLV